MRPALSALAFCLLASPAFGKVPHVVTDFAPIQSLVMQVMGKLGTPGMLSQIGADPHDFQLKPSQAATLADADVVFWDGPELTPALASAIPTLAPKALSVPLLAVGGGPRRALEGAAGTDPHAWLDPEIAEDWLGTIAATLGKLDPENANSYAANATAAQKDLQALDAKLKAELAPAKGVPIVEFHDAFGYFAAHYGLDVVGTIELGDAATPSAARLAEIRKTIRDSKAVCVFPETGRDPKFVATVLEGTGARAGAAQDPEATALTDTPSPALYGLLLQHLADTVANCVKG